MPDRCDWKVYSASIVIDMREERRKKALKWLEFQGFAMFGTRGLSDLFWLIMDKYDQMYESLLKSLKDYQGEL